MGSALNDAGHYQGDATSLGGCTPPRTGSSSVGGRWVLPSSFPPRAPPSQVVISDLLPFQGVWWVLLSVAKSEVDGGPPRRKTGEVETPDRCQNHPRCHFTSIFLRAPPAQVVIYDVDNLLPLLKMVVEEVVEKPPFWSLRLFSSSPSPSLLSSITSSSLPRSCHILILHQHFRLTMSVLFCSGAISGWMGWMGWKWVENHCVGLFYDHCFVEQCPAFRGISFRDGTGFKSNPGIPGFFGTGLA